MDNNAMYIPAINSNNIITLRPWDGNPNNRPECLCEDIFRDEVYSFVKWISRTSKYKDRRKGRIYPIDFDVMQKCTNRSLVLAEAHPGYNLFQALAFRGEVKDVVTDVINKITAIGYRDEISYNHTTGSFVLYFQTNIGAERFDKIYKKL